MAQARMFAGCLIALLWGAGLSAEEYKSAKEAYSVGAAFYNAKSYAKAQAPFEAAIAMDGDVKFRVDCYRALIASYRLLETGDKMTTAVEYLLEHSDRAAEKSLVQRSYLSFLHQRGLVDDAIRRYEERLKTKPEDVVALSILADIYGNLHENPTRAAELTKQLQTLVPADPKDSTQVLKQGELARQLFKAKKYQEAAELYESIAPLDPKLAAWHWKEAAACRVQEKDLVRAKEDALESSKSAPESRSEQLTYFWSRNLADILVSTGEYELAVKHYELALTKTTIDGYVKDTKSKLEEAKGKLAQQ